MKETYILFGLLLMIAGFILAYKSIKGTTSRRKRLEKLADSLVSAKDDFEYKLGRFEYLLDGMAADHEKSSTLKKHILRMEELVEELRRKQHKLETSNRSMADINAELKRSNAELVKRANQLRDEMEQGETAIRQMEEYLDSLKQVKEGLEIAVNNIPAEEVHCLAMPLFSMGITPAVKDRLQAHGILYVGDLIALSEEYLMEIWGVGPATLEKIKAKLDENGVCFGMDVIRVNNHWYRRKTD